MPLARLGTRLVYYAHIPKTGGTSVEAYLRARGRVALHYNKTGDWLKCSPQHIHAAVAQALFPPGFVDHSFTVLRDPVARLVSEYRHRIGRARARGRKIDPFDAWVPRVLGLALKNPYVLDNHLRPQAEFVTGDMRLFRLEDGLGPVFDWIDDISGAPSPAPRDWKRNLTHIEVTMRDDTADLIREFYAEDCRMIADLAG